MKDKINKFLEIEDRVFRAFTIPQRKRNIDSKRDKTRFVEIMPKTKRFHRWK